MVHEYAINLLSAQMNLILTREKELRKQAQENKDNPAEKEKYETHAEYKAKQAGELKLSIEKLEQ